MDRCSADARFQLARIFGIRIGADTSWFVFAVPPDLAPVRELQGPLPGPGLEVVHARGGQRLPVRRSRSCCTSSGHAVPAIRNGVGVSGIDLWIFGGFTKHAARVAHRRGADFKISAAGPLVTLVDRRGRASRSAPPAVGRARASGARRSPWQRSRRAGAAPPGGARAPGPLLPQRGSCSPSTCCPACRSTAAGSCARSPGAITGDRNRATRIAATSGRGLAYVLGGLGVVLHRAAATEPAAFWLLFVALILGQGARAAEAQTVIHSRIEHLRVADVMDSEPVTMPVRDHASTARSTTGSSATAGTGSRWSTRPAASWASPSRDATREVPRAAAAELDDQPGDGSTRPATHFRVGVDEPLEALLGSEALTAARRDHGRRRATACCAAS